LEVALVEGPLAVLAVQLRHPFLRVLVREGVVVHVGRRHRRRAHRGCRVRVRVGVGLGVGLGLGLGFGLGLGLGLGVGFGFGSPVARSVITVPNCELGSSWRAP